MTSRRKFIQHLMAAGLAGPFLDLPAAGQVWREEPVSQFCRRLKPVGRILEMEGYYVWCNTPIEGPDGKVHVFFSRWPEQYGMGGWISRCEIAHAVADTPEDTFRYVGTALSPRAGYFDATTCHNPHIQYIDGRYYLFYMGNANGRTNTKRIGLATADSLYGPWQRRDTPLLDVSPPGTWDDHCTTNPAFLRHPDGRCWLYYKSWNTHEYESAPKGTRIKGNRKYGLAMAERPEGPYVKYAHNPVIDFSEGDKNQQLEDAFVWWQDGKVHLIARDMGFFDHHVGLYFESPDGLQWPAPQIAFYEASHYIQQPPAPAHLSRYGRFERPQLLMKNGRPAYLFTASQGGRYMTASGFVFAIT